MTDRYLELKEKSTIIFNWTGMSCPECDAPHCAQTYDEDDNEMTWECRYCDHWWTEPINADIPTRTERIKRWT